MNRFFSFSQRHTLVRVITYIVIIVFLLNFQGIVQWVHGVDEVQWKIISVFLILVIAYEVWMVKYCPTRINNPVMETELLKPLVDDEPTVIDKLNRKKYVSMLGKKIISTYIYNNTKTDRTESADDKVGSSFAINIEEDYGYGKTSFLLMLKEWFKKQHEGQAIWIDFKPWLCDNASSLISEFFRQLAEEIVVDISLHDDIIKYGNVLSSQAIKLATGIQTPPLFSSRESSLKRQHDRIQEKLNANPQLIIVTIDDLDRLEKEEVMAVLKIIRDTADFPNVFYVTASEHTYLFNVLKVSNIDDPDRFIEKFFNLHFYLPAHEVNFRDIFINYLTKYVGLIIDDKEKRKEFETLKTEPILETCFSDIRDVKRFVNQLIIYLESLGNNDYNLYDATLLTLLQYKSSELYKLLRDRDDILLQTKYKGTDCILELKDDPVSEAKQREFLHMMYKDKGPTDQEQEKPISELYERHGKNIPYRNEHLGENILNVLFGSNTSNGEFTIKRSNYFFLYFSGREHSKSITKAETSAIIGMDLVSYKTAVDQLFQQGRADAFLHEITYVINNAKESDILDIIRKFFYFQYKQYDYTSIEQRRERSWYAVSIQSQNLFSILYVLMGDSTPRQYRRKDKPFPDLTSIINDEPLDYVIELVSILDTNIVDFEYQREVIDGWIQTVYKRFFTENLLQQDIFTDDNLRIMIYFREGLFSYQNEWDESFSKYLSSDKSIICLWLSHVIIDYGGKYEWNYSVKRAMFGSSFDYRGKTLLSELKETYTDLLQELDNLEFLLGYSNLNEKGEGIRNELFIKKFARKVN